MSRFFELLDAEIHLDSRASLDAEGAVGRGHRRLLRRVWIGYIASALLVATLTAGVHVAAARSPNATTVAPLTTPTNTTATPTPATPTNTTATPTATTSTANTATPTPTTSTASTATPTPTSTRTTTTETPGGAATPPAPSRLVAVVGDEPGTVDLSWAAGRAQDVAAYRVYRDGGFVSEVPGTTMSFVDTPGTGRFRYTVSAVAGEGLESAQSDPDDVDVPAASLPAPTGLTLDDSTGEICLTWVAPDDDRVEAFEVLRGDEVVDRDISEPRSCTPLPNGEGTFTYAVRSVAADGLTSVPSAAQDYSVVG